MTPALSVVPDTPQERSAFVVFLLMLGRRMTLAEIAEACNLTYGGAWWMMQNVSRVAPVYDDAGIWQIAPEDRKGCDG